MRQFDGRSKKKKKKEPKKKDETNQIKIKIKIKPKLKIEWYENVKDVKGCKCEIHLFFHVKAINVAPMK